MSSRESLPEIVVVAISSTYSRAGCAQHAYNGGEWHFALFFDGAWPAVGMFNFGVA